MIQQIRPPCSRYQHGHSATQHVTVRSDRPRTCSSQCASVSHLVLVQWLLSCEGFWEVAYWMYTRSHPENIWPSHLVVTFWLFQYLLSYVCSVLWLPTTCLIFSPSPWENQSSRHLSVVSMIWLRWMSMKEDEVIQLVWIQWVSSQTNVPT